MSANQAWRHVLELCLTRGAKVSPRGIDCYETLGVMTMIDMTRPCVFSRHRKVSPRFACGETLWYLSGKDDLETIKRYAPSYGRFSDDGVMLFGAYGPRIASQMESVITTLLRDPMSRQAVWNIWRENPPESKDIPCSLSTQFLIRDGRLDCIHTMRSNDAWVGFIYDVFSFSAISMAMALKLRDRGLHVELGNLILNVGSQHLYARNVEAAKEVLALGDEDCPVKEDIRQMRVSGYSSSFDYGHDLQSVADEADYLAAHWLRQWVSYHE